jgi:hypothetical protein
MSYDKDRTSAGVPLSEVPEFAKHHVEWIDGRHGSTPKADIGTQPRDVLFVPKADICGAANCSLFDHPIGAGLQRLWHGQTKGFGGLEINS